MTGAEALVYARSRHGSTDFDRGARQQRLLAVAPRAGRPRGADPAAARARSTRSEARSRPTSRRTSSRRCCGSPSAIDTRTSARTSSRRRSTAPRRRRRARAATSIVPNVDEDPGRGRDAFTADPARGGAAREAGRGGRRVWVLNGSGRPGQASRRRGLPRVSTGLTASAPQPEARRARSRPTRIVVYNGAEANAARDDRLPPADVRGDRHDRRRTRPSGRHRRSRRDVDARPRRRRRRRERRVPTRGPRRRRVEPSPASPAWRCPLLDRRQPVAYSGSRPRTASK